MAFKSQGTTVSFGGTVARVRGVQREQGGGEIDITNLSSTEKEFETDFDENTITLDLIGATAYTRGQTASLTINYADGTSKVIGNCMVMSVRDAARVGDAISSTVSFKKTSAS